MTLTTGQDYGFFINLGNIKAVQGSLLVPEDALKSFGIF